MNGSRTRVQEVLAEEGFEHDAALAAALERIAALRPAGAPAPSGELARLLAAASPERTTAPLAVVRELPATRASRKAEAAAAAASPRWVKRHRGAMIGVLVAAGMGLGASGVAAMTGQVWEWQIAVPPAVSPSTVHAGESPAAQATDPAVVPAGTATGSAGLSQRGAAAPGSAAVQQQGTGSGEHGSANPGSAPAQGKDPQGAGADRQSGGSSGSGRPEGSHGTQRQGAQPSSSPSASASAGDGQGWIGQGLLGQNWGGQNGQSPER